jgi:hypothetical protein
MAVEYPEPSPGHPYDESHDDVVVQAQANVAIQHWLYGHPEVSDGLTETIRAHIHLQELVRRTQAAEQVLGSAAPAGVDRGQRVAALERAVRELFPYS